MTCFQLGEDLFAEPENFGLFLDAIWDDICIVFGNLQQTCL